MKYFRRSKRYPRKSSRKYPRKSAVKTAIRKVRNSAFKKKVLSVIKSQAETKNVYMEKGWTDFNSAIASAGDAMRIIPFMDVGSGDYNRIGDQCRLQKLTLKGIINLTPQTAVNTYDTRKLAVRIMIVTPKSFPNTDQALANATTWMGYLLKKGSIQTGFNGSVHDLYAPVNTDAITCHYNKVFFLQQSAIFQSTASGVSEVNLEGVTKFWSKTFRFNNKLLKFDPNIALGQTPANYGPVLVLGYAFTDPSASPDTLTSRVRFHFSSNMTYEDA